MFQLSIVDHIRLSFGSAVGAYQGHTSAALRLSQWSWYSKTATLSLLGTGAAANLLALRLGGYGIQVTAAIIGLEVPNLTGIGAAKVLPNHHLTKPVLIGEVRADGQFDTVWKTPNAVAGDAWSDYLPAGPRCQAHRPLYHQTPALHMVACTSNPIPFLKNPPSAKTGRARFPCINLARKRLYRLLASNHLHR